MSQEQEAKELAETGRTKSNTIKQLTQKLVYAKTDSERYEIERQIQNHVTVLSKLSRLYHNPEKKETLVP